jgi:predicted ArsR family transcriptional regulator
MHSTPEALFLSDRAEILSQLSDVHGRISAARLARRCAMPVAAVQSHLDELERACVVQGSYLTGVPGRLYRFVESETEREARRSES